MDKAEMLRLLEDFSSGMNALNAESISDPEARKKIHLAHFFNAMEPHYRQRQQAIRDYVDGSNALLPQFDISREVMPDIFSYSGYSETDALRDQSKKNDAVVDLLDESLEKGPAMVIEIGTFDGKRTRSILNLLKYRSNIECLVGIDTNPAVLDAFKGLDIPNRVFNADAIQLLSLHMPYLSFFRPLPMRKIYLGLENVLMNITRLEGCEHQNFPGMVSNMLSPSDDVIFELSNYYDPSKYVDGVEEVFHKYFNETGLKDIIGGRLRVEEGRESPRKMILIEDIKEKVEYGGRAYNFSRPKYMMRSNMAGGDIVTDFLSQPIIFLGVSQSLPKEEVFMTQIMLYVNQVILQKQSDWRFIQGESVAKLSKDLSHKVVGDDELKRTMFSAYAETERRGMLPIFRSFTDVLMGTGQYPLHYNAFLDKDDEVFWSDQIADAVKCMMRARVGKTDPKLQQNMNRYIPKLLAGQARELKYDPWKGLNVTFSSMFDIKVPDQH
jgi:hypothetical protein